MTIATRVRRGAHPFQVAGRAPAPGAGEIRLARRGPRRLTVLVLVVGVVVTGVLTALSRVNYLSNEARLTRLQTQLTAAALDVAPVDLERRLQPAATGAAYATHPAAAFRGAIAPSLSPAGPFVIAGLAQIRDGRPVSLAHAGAASLLPSGSPKGLSLLEQAARSPQLITSRIVGAGGVQRLSYAISASGPSGTFVAWAGQALPRSRYTALPPGSPDASLTFAIYFGATTATSALIEADTHRLPLRGTISTSTVAFGNHVLTLVVSPRGSLAGAWSEAIAWAILGAGLALTAVIATITERLLRRQELAVLLADENEQLYREQRNVAETLQHALLPARLPEVPGVELAVRYLPGTIGIDIGGDWYDVIEVGGRLFFTVGDVAGRGLEAATLMASLRNGIRAFALDGESPARVLGKISQLLDAGSDGRFATVLCGLLDVASGELTVASAGHLAPLLLAEGSREFVAVALGPPIGVGRTAYESVTFELARGSTLLAYTDGLVERRGRTLTEGLEQLRESAAPAAPLQSLVDEVIRRLVPAGAPDDVAVLGMRWT